MRCLCGKRVRHGDGERERETERKRERERERQMDVAGILTQNLLFNIHPSNRP